jgi:hypothetical protein
MIHFIGFRRSSYVHLIYCVINLDIYGLLESNISSLKKITKENCFCLEDFAENKYTEILSGWQSRQLVHIDGVSENKYIFKTDEGRRSRALKSRLI